MEGSGFFTYARSVGDAGVSDPAFEFNGGGGIVSVRPGVFAEVSVFEEGQPLSPGCRPHHGHDVAVIELSEDSLKIFGRAHPFRIAKKTMQIMIQFDTGSDYLLAA